MDIKLIEPEDQPLYDSLQRVGNEAAMKKMLKYDKEKSGCCNIDLDYAGDKIKEHSEELLEELAFNNMNMGNFDNIISEAANLRNYIDMIIYKCKSLKGEIR